VTSKKLGGIRPLLARHFPSVVPQGRPRGHWQSRENRKAFLDNAAAQLGLPSTNDWRTATASQLADLGGAGLLATYGGFRAVLLDTYGPDVLLPEPLTKNTRAFFDEAAQALSISSPEDWKGVNERALVELGGGGVLKQHSGSILLALQAAYPEEEAYRDPRRCRPQVPIGFWAKKENQREFMDSVAKKMGVKCPADWRAVTSKCIKELGGETLLRHHGGVLAALQAVYPEEDWFAHECRPNVPAGYWQDMAVQRKFLADFAEKAGVVDDSHWARVREEDIAAAGGGGLLKHTGSLFNALRNAYPEKEWDITVCRPLLPEDYWTEETVRASLESVRDELDIESKEEWARVSHAALLMASQRTGGAHRLLQKMTLSAALSLAYPLEDWSHVEELQKAMPAKKASQWLLKKKVQRLFPDSDVLENHLHHSLVRQSSAPVELDVFLPAQCLAFEFQGQHHFDEVPAFGCLEVHQHRDEEKRSLCQAHGIRLVEVPYWWDFELPSLAATVYQRYPALLHDAVSSL